MFQKSTKSGARALVSAAFAAALLFAGPHNLARSAVPAGGPFADLTGTWSGEGTVTTSNGTSERIRCKAKYSVSPSGADLHQTLRCASDSYRFDVSADVVYEDGAVSGTWTEATRQASGHLTGRLNGSAVEATIAGTGFTARLALTTRGGQQAVSIRPTDVDVTAITISLRRG